jgi:hypothetical protein
MVVFFYCPWLDPQFWNNSNNRTFTRLLGPLPLNGISGNKCLLSKRMKPCGRHMSSDAVICLWGAITAIPDTRRYISRSRLHRERKTWTSWPPPLYLMLTVGIWSMSARDTGPWLVCGPVCSSISRVRLCKLKDWYNVTRSAQWKDVHLV